ncbi:TPM domain-containing protein [Brevundimonas sp.]|uniref:TPM domain-containing protein n=1 Tax=Brevundimonas sp. TaxID=1871086 RepID=UPI002899703D|nr:TPM domain-containing protein [Brevundimonas sp.]
MKRAIALLFVLGLWLGTALPLPALAQTGIQFPALTGRVVDNADILTPQQEAELTQKLAILEQQTTDQLVVVTLPSLNDYDIADYGYQLGRHWGIGQKEANNGALLIVAPNERKVRVEVGYGLEGILTDAFSALTIQNFILPPFREGDYYSGINAGVDQISYQLTLDPEEAAARAAEMATQVEEGGSGAGILIIIIGVFGVIFVIGSVVGAASAGSGRRMQGAADGAGAVLWTTAQIIAAIASSSGSGGGRGGGGGGGFGGGGGGFGGGGASGGW